MALPLGEPFKQLNNDIVFCAMNYFLSILNVGIPYGLAVQKQSIGWVYNNLIRVIPLFTLSHRGSYNSPLLIVFSANYKDQSIVTKAG